MQELKERIIAEGIVREGNVLKVDSFLNHQCDVTLYQHMGDAWAQHFADKKIDKILTVAASGIGISCVAALSFGGVPVVFARKAQSINLDGDQHRHHCKAIPAAGRARAAYRRFSRQRSGA